MKWSKQDPYVKAGITIFVTGAALMCIYRLFHSVDNLWMSVRHTAGALLAMLTPFFIAMAMAYLLKPVRNGVARVLQRIFPRVRQERIRTVAVAAAMLIFLAAVGTILGLLIPAIWKNLMDLIYQLPGYFTRAETLMNELAEELPYLANLNLNMDQMEVQVQTWLQGLVANHDLGQLAGQVAGQVVATVGGVFTWVVSFVLSLAMCIYLLKSGHQLAAGIKEVMTRQLGEKRTGRWVGFFREIDGVFGQYISGKVAQSFVMFLMILPLFLLLGVPYAPLMAVIVAVTNLIPYMGPFIGGAVPVFFMLLVNPIKALLVLAAVLLVQQIDNYLVEPRLIGNRMGMHPFWVITCVIIGGEIWGVLGILLAVPLAGVLRIAVNHYFEARDIRRKRKEEETEE